MRKHQLEAALQAAAEICGDSELVLAGSQAVFGHTDQVPVETLMSEECDVWRRSHMEKLIVIAGLGCYRQTHRNVRGPASAGFLAGASAYLGREDAVNPAEQVPGIFATTHWSLGLAHAGDSSPLASISVCLSLKPATKSAIVWA